MVHMLCTGNNNVNADTTFRRVAQINN